MFTDAGNKQCLTWPTPAFEHVVRNDVLLDVTFRTALDAHIVGHVHNDGYTWEDTEGLDMTGSSKQLKNKTVGGDVFYTDMLRVT